MNKFKVLGAALMAVIIFGILLSWNNGFTSIQWITKNSTHFLFALCGLCIILFGSFAALTLDKLN